MKKNKILLIEDEEILRFTFKSFLLKKGYEVFSAENYEIAVDILCSNDVDLIIADILLGKHSGIDILKTVKEKKLKSPVVLITGQPSIETASDSVRLGAYDYLTKPVDKQTLLKVTELALQHKILLDEKDRIEAEKEKYRSEMETIFRSVQEGIITVDMHMRIQTANRAVQEVCRLTPNHIIGMQYDDLPFKCMHACRDIVENTIKTKKEIRSLQVECRHDERDKQIVDLTGSPLLNSSGHFIGAALVIRDITKEHRLERELKKRFQFDNIVGRSEKMQEIYALLEDLTDSTTTVLITGESGTGKELVAGALHYKSARGQKPFIKVNCSALSESILESELFGHVKGSFTGAIRDKIGRFEMANGGSILLDEIGDISPNIQKKLLRVLQEKEIERVGDSKPIQLNVRVIVTTNKDLKEAARLNRFREDLYYRLKVIELALPPLRERIEDIPMLIDHFIKRFNIQFNKNIIKISDDAKQRMLIYSWPGNVRELEHAIEHAFVLCHDQIIKAHHLPSEIRLQPMGIKVWLSDPHNLDQERQQIISALKTAGGNKAKAAKILKIHRRTLYRKLSLHNIPATIE